MNRNVPGADRADKAPLRGVVETVDGNAVQSAKVFICVDPASQFVCDGDRLSEVTPDILRKRSSRPKYGNALFRVAHMGFDMTETNRDGEFTFQSADSPSLLAVLDAAGYAVSTPPALARSRALKLAPWAQIRGHAKIGEKACGPGDVISLFAVISGDPNLAKVWLMQNTQTDEHGDFHFDRVLGGDIRITRKFPPGTGFASNAYTSWFSTTCGETRLRN